MNIKNAEIKVIMGDITELKVDAIVNATDTKLAMSDGLALAIKKKGGNAIEKEAAKLGPINIGEAVVTSGGSLFAKYIIHAATIEAGELQRGRQAEISQADEMKIRDSCRNALKLAGQLKISSVALPTLDCQREGFSFKAQAKIMAQEVFGYLKGNYINQGGGDEATLKEIIFCLPDRDAYEIFQKNALGYLDYIINKLKCPYVTVDVIIEATGSIEALSAASDFSSARLLEENSTSAVKPILPEEKSSAPPLIERPAPGTDNNTLPIGNYPNRGFKSNGKPKDIGIVIIKRSNPPLGWALPGGFVDYGESLEEAAIREVKEETDLEITEIQQFYTYSQPQRDRRFHTVSTVFIAQAKGIAKPGDDAAGLKIVKLDEIEKLNFAFDHKKILKDYIKNRDKNRDIFHV